MSTLQYEIHFPSVVTPKVDIYSVGSGVAQVCAYGAFDQAPPITAVRLCITKGIVSKRGHQCGIKHLKLWAGQPSPQLGKGKLFQPPHKTYLRQQLQIVGQGCGVARILQLAQ